MWIAIGAPVLMIVALVLVVALWMWTGPIVALIVFAVVCSAAVSAGAALQRRSRGL